MLDRIETIFDNMGPMLKKVKKKKYEENMKEFREKYNHYFFEMTDYMKAEKKEVMAREIAETFVRAVKERFEIRGRIKGYQQIDLNFFMIYYVFPAILMTQHEDARLIADTLCETWGNSFKDSKIQYTDYDTLYQSFREKIFGII